MEPEILKAKENLKIRLFLTVIKAKNNDYSFLFLTNTKNEMFRFLKKQSFAIPNIYIEYRNESKIKLRY